MENIVSLKLEENWFVQKMVVVVFDFCFKKNESGNRVYEGDDYCPIKNNNEQLDSNDESEHDDDVINNQDEKVILKTTRCLLINIEFCTRPS